MKQLRKVIVLALIISSFTLRAQSHTASGGGEHENSDVKVTVTIGEPITGEISNNEASVDVGFQRTYESELLTIDESISELNLMVYPNPTVDKITVKNNQQSPLQVSLIGLNGKSLSEMSLEGSDYTISLNKYPAGIYFLKFYNPQINKIKTFKIIKK